LDNSGCGK